jgi:hypothetical protein
MTALLAFLFAILSAVLPPCESEHSEYCHWDASVRGNGQGASFVTFRPDAYTVVWIYSDGTMSTYVD